MFEAIGELLPLAVGVSISPLPIIAMIVLLMSPQARLTAPVFLLGWLAAIVGALLLFSWLSDLGLGSGGKGHGAAMVKLVVGVLLLGLAWHEWRARPAPGEVAALPHWLAAVEHMGPLAAAGLGFGIYAANPKNLTVGMAAGISFGAHHLPPGQTIFTVIIYLLIAAVTIWLPILGYFLAERRVRPWLDEMRVWLTQHNAAVMAVLLLVIGAMMSGKGIAALAP